jgi:GT2 family glycosyltransferase
MRFLQKIGIVTVLYNSETVLDEYFDSLKNQSYDNFLLYVIDNKSTDLSLKRSKELAKTVSFKTIFIENDGNYGVAKGNNQGIEAALADCCDYVLLSNNDIVLKKETIERLCIGLNERNVDIVVPKIYYHGTNKIWAAGGNFIKFLGSTKQRGQGKEEQGQYNRDCRIDYAPTCFMLMRSDVFYDVGMMDEKYFVYYDDTDFLYRALLKKKIVFYIYRSVIDHKVSISTGSNSDFFFYYVFRNRIYYIRKHYGKYLYPLYFINILYHYTIRNIKMLNNRHGWRVVKKALFDGLSY